MTKKETEDESKVRKEIERLAKEHAGKKVADTSKTKGVEAKAKKEAERLAKEKAKKEAEEAKKAKKEAEKLAKEQAKQAKKAKKEPAPDAGRLAKEQAKQTKKAKKGEPELAQDVSSASYEGNFQLVLPSSAGFKQVNLFTESLAGIEDLKIVWTGGSMDEGTLIAISVAQAVPLAHILSDMPMVEGVEVKGDKISVTLKGAI